MKTRNVSANLLASAAGNSFLDVIIFMVASIAAFYFALTYLAINTRYASNADTSQLLVDLVDQNVLDVNAKTLNEMPPVGGCLVRNYDEKGNYLNENVIPIATSSCTDGFTSGFRIAWKATVPANYTFKILNGTKLEEDKTFLKLPAYANKILQIQIVGHVKSSSFEREISISLLKDNK